MPSDDEGPPEAVAETPEQIAKKMFMGAVNQACPVAKHSSGGGNNASLEGVVIRTNKISVQGKGGMVPKMQVTVAVSKFMTSGAKDIISPGMDGVAFGLPTKNLEASPDEIAKNKDAKGPVVLDIVDGNSKANYLGIFSASFYMEPPGASAQDKKGPGVETCTVGTKVLVSGISCVYSKTGTALYSNAKKITPLVETVSQADAAEAIIAEARSNGMQGTSSFLWSMAMKGFFGLTYAELPLQQQADACKAKWQQLVEGTASKIESVALSLSGDASMETQVSALGLHAARIRAISPEEAASGAPIFLTDLQKDTVTPYVAPIVQYGVSPGNDVTQMCADMFDPSKRDKLPNSFVEGKVKDVSFKGSLVQVDYRLFFVYDKTAAILALQDGSNPILHTTNAAACVKMTKKSVGPEMVGSVVDGKIEAGIKEVLPFCNQAPFASVYPRGADDLQIDGHFASSNAFDFKDGIQKAGIQVSEKWLDEKMLSGRGVFIHSDIEGQTKIEASATAGPAPVLAKAGYQCLTEGSFDFDSLKVPAGKMRKYYVVYDGCSTNVARDSSLATSVDSGESHLSDVVGAAREDGDMKAFLREDCLVYAVAASA
jgi:hypothetical protein